MNIIETLSAGMNAVYKQLWLLIVPILVDLFLWMGPQITVEPLLINMANNITTARAEIAAMPNIDQETIESLNALADFTQNMATSETADINIAALVEVFAVRVPMIVVLPSAPENSSSTTTIEIDSQGAFWGICFLLLLIGSAISAMYLTIAAQGIREVDPPKPFFHQLRRNWAYMTLIEILIILVIIMVGLPTALIFLVLGMFLPSVISLIVSIMTMTMLWIGFYAVFTLDALFVSDTNPLQALWHSVNIVQRNFWSALGFLILVNVISLGLTVIWNQISVNPFGALISIVGSAYVGTGLVLASFIFYRDRFTRWQEEKEEV